MKHLWQAFKEDGDFEVSDFCEINYQSSAFLLIGKSSHIEYIAKDRAGYGYPSENVHFIVDRSDSYTVMEVDKATLDERSRRLPDEQARIAYAEIARVVENARDKLNKDSGNDGDEPVKHESTTGAKMKFMHVKTHGFTFVSTQAFV